MLVCLCVCLGFIDTCKICMPAVLCTCALIYDTPMTVYVCVWGKGVGGWRAAAFLIPFNSIRWDVSTCVEYHLLAYAKHTARGLHLSAIPPKLNPPL